MSSSRLFEFRLDLSTTAVRVVVGVVMFASTTLCEAQPNAVTRFNEQVANARRSGEPAVLRVYAQMRTELYAEAARCESADCIPVVWSALTAAQGLMDWDKVSELCRQGEALQPQTISKLSWQAVESSALLRRAEIERQPAFALRAGGVVRDALAPVWMELGAGRLTLTPPTWQHVLSMVSQQAQAWEVAGDFPAAAAAATLAAQIADMRRADLAEAPAALMPDEFLRRAALAHTRAGNVDQATASLLGIDLLSTRRKDSGFHVLLMLDEAAKADGAQRQHFTSTIDRWLASRSWDARTPHVVIKLASLELAGTPERQGRVLALIRSAIEDHRELLSDSDAMNARESGVLVESPQTPEWRRREMTFGLWNLRMELASSLGRPNEARLAATTLLSTFGADHPASDRCKLALGY